MLAHELRNPLAPIRYVVEILRRSGDDEHKVTSATEMMQRQVGQLVRLVDDLLDVSRISRGKIELRVEPVELTSIVQAATLTGVSLVAAVSGLVWLGIWNAQRRHGALSRAGRLREAVSRMVDRPERVAAEPTVPARIVAGVLTGRGHPDQEGARVGGPGRARAAGARGSRRPSGHPGGTA